MSTALFTPVIGQQGASCGVAQGGVYGVAMGGLGYQQAMAVYGMKIIVEQTQVPLVVDPAAEGTVTNLGDVSVSMILGADADATPVVSTNTAVPLVIDADSTGTVTNLGTATVPIQLGASSTARGRVTAAVTAAIKWVATATVVQRIRATVTVPLRTLTTVVGTITNRAFTAVPLPLVMFITSFAKQPPRVIRVLKNLSRTVVGPANDQSRPSVSVRDNSETQ
jgi:hypothetical protein